MPPNRFRSFRPAHELTRELLKFPRPRRLLAAGSLRRYRDSALVEHLVAQCWEHRYGDPDTMLDYAETAVAVARRLPPDASASDALCRACLHLSNTHRRRAEFDLASAMIVQAKAAWASGSQKPALRAEMERLEGALLHDLRQLDAAASSFRTAAELYGSLGDAENRASALISEGMALREAGNPEDAVVPFHQALLALGRRGDAKLRISGLQCFCRCLCDLGQYEHAHFLSRASDWLFSTSREPGIAIRVAFLNAQIDEGLGHRLAAEDGYERCRQAFAAAGLLYERALATLYLAALLAKEGRSSDVRELCGEVSGVFDALGIARESTAASLLRDAMARPKAELVKAVLQYLEWEGRQPARRSTAG
jgi:tetratricopeptide (TPR) repeat protein